MRIVVFLFVYPLIAAGCSVGVVWALKNSYPQYFKWLLGNGFELAVIGGLIFCATLVLINHVVQTLMAMRIAKSHKAIVAYEKEIRKRLEESGGSSVEINTLEHYSKRLKALEARLRPSDVPAGTHYIANSNRAVEAMQNGAVELGGDSKVISIDKAKRSGKAAAKAEPAPGKIDLAECIENDRVKMYLQPIVSLPGREVPAYEVLASVAQEDGKRIPATELAGVNSKELLPKVDQAMLKQAIGLLRKLKRERQTIDLYWNISKASLNLVRHLEAIADIFNANRNLLSHLVVEISLDDYTSLTKKQMSALAKLRELGAGLAIERCEDVEASIRAIETGMFSHIKFPADMMEHYVGEDTESEGQKLAEAARNHPIRVIASHVEQEHQVLSLIDVDVELAQGLLFSEPKPLQTADAEKDDQASSK